MIVCAPNKLSPAAPAAKIWGGVLGVEGQQGRKERGVGSEGRVEGVGFGIS